MNSNKLSIKDMINVGIFATIFAVIKIISGFAGVVPIICVILPAITALISAPVYALFYSKVKKFGMITALTSVLGLLYFIVGYGWQTFVGSVIIGILADWITKLGEYRSKRCYVLGYCIFSLWTITTYISIWMSGDAYFKELSKSMGQNFADEFQKLLPVWSVFPLILLTFFAAWIGTIIGRKMMKKHFERIGV